MEGDQPPESKMEMQEHVGLRVQQLNGVVLPWKDGLESCVPV